MIMPPQRRGIMYFVCTWIGVPRTSPSTAEPFTALGLHVCHNLGVACVPHIVVAAAPRGHQCGTRLLGIVTCACTLPTCSACNAGHRVVVGWKLVIMSNKHTLCKKSGGPGLVHAQVLFGHHVTVST